MLFRSSHSLGSRAALDAMQRLTNLPVSADPRLQGIADDFKAREVQVFMLSNQLPLLEAGREGQQVVDQVGAYCGPSATKAGRFFAKTQLPLLTAQKSIIENTDNSLMELDEAAF